MSFGHYGLAWIVSTGSYGLFEPLIFRPPIEIDRLGPPIDAVRNTVKTVPYEILLLHKLYVMARQAIPAAPILAFPSRYGG